MEPAELRLDQIDREKFDELVGRYRGQVILVDFWGTYCEPCLGQFPHVVELAKRHGGRGLVVLSILCDDAQNEDEARKFLRRQAAPFSHFRSAHGSREQTFLDFEIDGGALPHYKLFDRRGNLRHVLATDFDRPLTPDRIDAAVEELLEER